ncbi:collagen alpha-1(I) chain-like, partial [Herpailurus yagouaroundi]|uniref:collagen alpha-1(I) chain-like n=1 Tax=Herpailurus yagouaroundi TaxID=1608482 RepID=UPI001AD79D5F
MPAPGGSPSGPGCGSRAPKPRRRPASPPPHTPPGLVPSSAAPTPLGGARAARDSGTLGPGPRPRGFRACRGRGRRAGGGGVCDYFRRRRALRGQRRPGPDTARVGVMLKMMTFFQGLPGQQTAPGVPDPPRSSQELPPASEVESEASMSEASSEDLVPPQEAKGAPDRDEEEATKKKKNKRPKGLANVFSVFTKGRKKKGQPSSAEPEGQPESQPELSGPLPTGRPGPRAAW